MSAFAKSTMTIDSKQTPFGKALSLGFKDIGGVKVGVLGSQDSELILIAATNEFGTTIAGKNNNVTIPERNFIRSTFDENVDKLMKLAERLYDKILGGKLTPEAALKLWGNFLVGLIQEKIVSLKSPVNAKSTIKKKGSENPLIDTGRLRQSISFELDDK